MAGYSTRSLLDKLGFKPGQRIVILQAPKNYGSLLVQLPPGMMLKKQLRGQCDGIHFFTRRRQDLIQHLPQLKAALLSSGMLWVSWPKKSAGVATDLDENIIRQLALKNGLVDVKVCAVDDTWSGLKLVFRLRDRPKL